MAQLPFELQKLPPSALDVLRYFIVNGNNPADDVDIMDGAGLSERSFSKAIKRLVTKKFAEMDSQRMYTLTEKGHDLMQELAKYDEETGGGGAAKPAAPAPSSVSVAPVQRRMVVVVPEPLMAGSESQVFVGINDGLNGGSADVMVRVSCLNGEPAQQDTAISVNSGSTHTAFHVTPGEFTQMRLRVEAYQMDAFSGDLTNAGGMYVDVDITKDENESVQRSAYGTDVTVLPG
ncbi:MAG: winged helix-turn-helix domain-containing protein [Chloroflexota bacterium]